MELGQNRALERRLRNGRLQGPCCVEDIDYRTPRGLDRQVAHSLAQESAWVREHQNLFLIGPTGIGKTWLARAFAQKACRDGYTALFQKAAELFRSLATSRADGSHSKLLYQLGRVDLLIVDDWAMAPMSETERRDFLEICDARYQARSLRRRRLRSQPRLTYGGEWFGVILVAERTPSCSAYASCCAGSCRPASGCPANSQSREPWRVA